MKTNCGLQIADCRLGTSRFFRLAICNPKSAIRNRVRRRRRAFTLSELMIVIAIIAILSGLGLSAMNGATNLAREHRTGAQIAKIDQLLMERYEGYRTRAVPVKIMPIPAVTTGQNAIVIAANINPLVNLFPASSPSQPPIGRANALLRLLALRALMRMELPDRRTDIIDYSGGTPALVGPGSAPLPTGGTFNLANWMAPAALQKSYFRMAVRALGGQPNTPATYSVLTKWTDQHEGAECLYLIVATMRDGDKSALDYFDGSEIGDVDQDGMKEILDGWGNPIEFLRWAPAFVSTTTAQVSTTQVPNAAIAPDPFDPAKVDPRWSTALPPYALYPLIYSAGPDKQYDIAADYKVSGNALYYAAFPPAGTSPAINLPNDPYILPLSTSQLSAQFQLGTPTDANADGFFSFFDNITNHSLATQK